MEKREIKFRAWDIPSKFMYCGSNHQIGFNGLCLSNVGEDITSDIVLMQFTGIKDELGIDIYEGDYIQNEPLKANGQYWEVEFDRGCFGSKGMALRAMIGMRVIGNIFEGIKK